MRSSARECELEEILALRQEYRQEMNCQILHDSIHERAGWSREYACELGGSIAGYGSVAIAGPWRDTPALYEFYVQREYRRRIFELFEALAAVCNASIVETQTNDKLLSVMLQTYTRNVRSESILFEDSFETRLKPAGAKVHAARPEDTEILGRFELDTGAGWVLTLHGEIAGAGGVLYHYNRPYGDVYMKIAEQFRRRGLGAYLVQELKAACRDTGSTPAARCNTKNEASRRTLQKAGFVPCGNGIMGDFPQPKAQTSR